MVRVTNLFDAQLRLPASEWPMSSHRRKPGSGINGSTRPVSQQDCDEQMSSWYGKVLDSVRLRYRKLQRFVR